MSSALLKYLDSLPPLKTTHLKIDFNDPWIDYWVPLLRREALRKSFEEIELFDVRSLELVNTHRVVTLHDGDRVRFLKGAVYAKEVL